MGMVFEKRYYGGKWWCNICRQEGEKYTCRGGVDLESEIKRGWESIVGDYNFKVSNVYCCVHQTGLHKEIVEVCVGVCTY